MKKILIVVDAQNDFIDKNVLGNQECFNVVAQIVKKINEKENANAYIIATKDTHYDNYLETQEGKKLPVIHCIKDTKGWEIVDEIKEALLKHGCEFVNKESFGSLELADRVAQVKRDFELKGESIEIELCGVCTDICVVSNAMILKAKFPETKISVDAKCCAGVTKESHIQALNTMKMCQIDILNEEDK